MKVFLSNSDDTTNCIVQIRFPNLMCTTHEVRTIVAAFCICHKIKTAAADGTAAIINSVIYSILLADISSH